MSIGHMQDQGLRAAREGRSIRRWLDGTTVTAAYVVQTDALIYYNIPEGRQVVITKAFFGTETVSEEILGYLVGCDAVAGGGTPTQVHHHNHVVNGLALSGRLHFEKNLNPLIVLKYSEGHRSVSMAIKATDTATVVTFGWNGWVEDEGTLS